MSIADELETSRALENSLRMQLQEERESSTRTIDGLHAELQARDVMMELQYRNAMSAAGELETSRALENSLRMQLQEEQDSSSQTIKGLHTELRARCVMADLQHRSAMSAAGELETSRTLENSLRMHLQEEREASTRTIDCLNAELRAKCVMADLQHRNTVNAARELENSRTMKNRLQKQLQEERKSSSRTLDVLRTKIEEARGELNSQRKASGISCDELRGSLRDANSRIQALSSKILRLASSPQESEKNTVTGGLL